MKTILFCTVGGSHQPIVTAIKDSQPDYVVFFCTDKDPGTNKPGSETQITGKGNFLKEDFKPETKPTLPNIPTQTNLTEEQFEVVFVPADELQVCSSVMQNTIKAHSVKHPLAELVADCTGGTKTMSTALAMKVVQIPNVSLRLVVGSRSDLKKVADGSQYQVEVNLEVLRFEPMYEKALSCWSRFGWRECIDLLEGLKPREPQLRDRWQRARMISKAFAAWDLFDYKSALQTLENFNAVIAKTNPEIFSFLQSLCPKTDSEKDMAKSIPPRLWDLWLNALRCGLNGRYDDAVARLYRLLEWSAQWQLQHKKEIKTGDLPEDIAKKYGASSNSEGRYQAGLYKAWEILENEIADSPLAQFYQKQKNKMKDQIQKRNNSLLAHGTTPVSKTDWEEFKGWMEQQFIPSLAEALQEKPFKQKQYEQLPNSYIWDK